MAAGGPVTGAIPSRSVFALVLHPLAIDVRRCPPHFRRSTTSMGAVGDAVLAICASALPRRCAVMTCWRAGGDEFVLMLSGISVR